MEWNCSAREIAIEIGVSVKTVSAVCKAKGWTGRLRVSQPRFQDVRYGEEEIDLLDLRTEVQ